MPKTSSFGLSARCYAPHGSHLVRCALMQTLSYFGKLPERQPASRHQALARGLRLPLPVSVKVNVAAS